MRGFDKFEDVPWVKAGFPVDYLYLPSVALSKYEQNEREPDYKTLILIADYFKVSIDYLLGRVEEPGQFFLDEALSGISEDLKEEILEYLEFLKQKRR